MKTNNLTDIPTPALVLDLDGMESNIRRMADYFIQLRESGRNVGLRPHVKTHRCPGIARKQIEAGGTVGGVTCSKLSEAEVMVAGGISDVLIANQIAGRQRIGKLIDLGRKADVAVAVDNAQNIRDLAAAASADGRVLGVLVEIDVGLGRCGVRSIEDAVVLARLVRSLKGVEFRGLQGYEGHLVNVADRGEREAAVACDAAVLLAARKELASVGIDVPLISGGGTGTYDITSRIDGINEIQYVFMDTNYRKVLREFDCALFLLTTVVSVPEKGLIITDSGLKSLATDQGALPQPVGFAAKPLVCHEEHTLIRSQESGRFKIGDRIRLIVGHACTTVNLHDYYYCVRGDKVQDVWAIEARGKCQ